VGHACLPSSARSSSAIRSSASTRTTPVAGCSKIVAPASITRRPPTFPSRELPTSATSRLPRPDGNGTFIQLTGIHAVGSHGIIDFLRRELADLYEQVDLQPFSTLIATEYDPVTRKLVRSERIAPLYRHQER
jgi:hypothetical protein